LSEELRRKRSDGRGNRERGKDAGEGGDLELHAAGAERAGAGEAAAAGHSAPEVPP